VLPEDQDEPPSDLRELADWAWLAQPLIEASEVDPDAIFPQLVRLLGHARTHPRIRPPGMVREYRFDSARLDGLFGPLADAVVRLIADVSDSSDWAVLEAAAQCRERLQQT
jgi:predicted component of type VI protein secretion system